MTAPFQRSVSSNFFVELSPNESKSVGNSITFFVKFSGTKVIIAGSVQQLNVFDCFVEEISDYCFLFRGTNNKRRFHKLAFLNEGFGSVLSDVLSRNLFHLT
jgi:hypothetical protein